MVPSGSTGDSFRIQCRGNYEFRIVQIRCVSYARGCTTAKKFICKNGTLCKTRTSLRGTPLTDILCRQYKIRLRHNWRSCLLDKNTGSTIPFVFLNRITRKIMNITRSLHLKYSVQRIYLPRRSGGRGLLYLESLHDRICKQPVRRLKVRNR